MSIEAAAVDTGTPAPEGAGNPAPEQGAPQSSPENNQPAGNDLPPTNEAPETPENNIEQPTGIDAQIQIYQDVVSKFNEDSNYQMTAEEAEDFMVVDQGIMDGSIKDPGTPKPSDEKPTEKQEKPAEDKDRKAGDEPDPDLEPEADVPGISGDNHDILIGAMKQVGAKDLSQLGPKIEGLIKVMKESGGNMGTELKGLKTQQTQHISWLQDLAAGNPAAIDHLNKLTGKKFALGQPKEASEVPAGDDADLDPGEFLDDKLVSSFNNLKSVVESQGETIKEQADVITKLSEGDQTRAEASSRNTAADGWIDDITDLVTDNKEAFSITPSEARALGKLYWSPKGHEQPVHPKFQQIHELIVFAHEKGLPDLKTAHILWKHENGQYAKDLIDATKKGQQSVQHQPSANSFLSKQQSKTKSNVPSPNITEENVSAMENGGFSDIPDEWMDEDGNLMPDKVPERYHAKAFGKLGKPK